MRKILLCTLLFSLAASAGAADVTVSPTTTSGPDAVDVGSNKASVSQTVKLILPERTALHLDVTDLKFDLTPTAFNSSTMQCVQGLKSLDVKTTLGADSFNQLQVAPNGVTYKISDHETWATGHPQIVLQNVARVANSYPPVIIDPTTKELVPGSKDNFVCFRTFVLQQFSNLGNFKLSVSRDDPKGAFGHQKIYIQANSCKTIYEGADTGLFALPSGSTRELSPLSYTIGTTGAQSDACDVTTKSWLDSLIVVGVKINGDLAGTNTATLTYTLDSRATPFKVSDSASKGSESY